MPRIGPSTSFCVGTFCGGFDQRPLYLEAILAQLRRPSSVFMGRQDTREHDTAFCAALAEMPQLHSVAAWLALSFALKRTSTSETETSMI